VDDLFDAGEPAFQWRGISTGVAAAAADVPVTTVRTWVSRAIAVPTYRPARSRQGAAYYWTPVDVVGLRALHLLRSRGCATPVLKLAWAQIRAWGERDTAPVHVLLWTGDAPRVVHAAEMATELTELSAVLAVVVIPLTQWLLECARTETVEFDLRDAAPRTLSEVDHDLLIGSTSSNLRVDDLMLPFSAALFRHNLDSAS
jgi:hypothetical protein